MKTKCLVGILLLAALPTLANAAVLYEQTTIDATDRGAYQDFCQQLADDFIPLTTGTVANVTWQGSYYGADNPAGTESFTIQLYADNAGLPANAPFYQTVGPASKTAAGTLLGKTLYNYALAIGNPQVNAGTKYWISIYTNLPCSNYAWTDSSDGTANGIVLRNSGGPWIQLGVGTRQNHIFVLNGPQASQPIPTLSEWGMIGMAALLAGVGVWAMRRRLTLGGVPPRKEFAGKDV